MQSWWREIHPNFWSVQILLIRLVFWYLILNIDHQWLHQEIRFFYSISKLLPSCSRKNKQITNRNGKDKNDNCIFFWFGFEDVGKWLENVIVVIVVVLDAESTTDRRRGKLKRAVPGSYGVVMWGLRAIFIFSFCFYFFWNQFWEDILLVECVDCTRMYI